MNASQVVTKENARVVRDVIKFVLENAPPVDPLAARLYELATAVDIAEKQAESEMLDVPTWKRRYLGQADGKWRCSQCPSTSLVEEAAPRTHSDPTLVSQDVECIECGARWRDWFKLADVEMLPREEKEVSDGLDECN